MYVRGKPTKKRETKKVQNLVNLCPGNLHKFVSRKFRIFVNVFYAGTR